MTCDDFLGSEYPAFTVAGRGKQVAWHEICCCQYATSGDQSSKTNNFVMTKLSQSIRYAYRIKHLDKRVMVQGSLPVPPNVGGQAALNRTGKQGTN
ncbi:hypothetical protein SPHINGOR109_10658 [Sphingorhabdus sp. 109]|nr:hypothetical protein SPHINGOR109_10658 [Sphingorhabdus sp. 109]